MIRFLFVLEGAVLSLALTTTALVLATIAAVVVERVALAWSDRWHRRLERRFGPVIALALSGDDEARRELAALPRRQRFGAARLIILPLVEDRAADHVAAARDLVGAMQILSVARRYLHSRCWWRRALALQVLGLVKVSGFTEEILGRLDDRHADVRGAALDALADLQDPASLPALIARIHDPTLHLGRRAAAIAAFGTRCEPFVLQLAAADAGRRWSCAKALTICGTAAARPALCEWAGDRRGHVRIAALEALAHVGLDSRSAPVALAALESDLEAERAMAARALRGWTGPGNAAAHLARHLDDTWAVAVQAAQSLRSMQQAGRHQLERCAERQDLPGLLARQVLWEPDARC